VTPPTPTLAPPDGRALRRVDPLPEDLPTVGTEVLRRTSGRTSEDLYTLLGSVGASLASTWVLYTRVFPFEGTVGFVVLLYVVFTLYYAVLTSLSHPRPVVVDRVVSTAVIAAPALVGVALVSVIAMTLVKGLPALSHLNFFTQDMSGVRASDPFTRGGILHAMVGTLIEVGIAISIALPLGVAAAVYMSEVGGRLARLVRTVVEAMTALPSIVAGLFIYSTCLVYLGMPASGLAAGLALAVMALPILARAAYVVLGVVPGGLREASYALGATRWQTVWRVVLPTSRPGLATALILGIARAVGETSPVLLTSGASTYFNANPTQDPMNSLPLFIYASVTSGSPAMEERAYAASAVLLVVVLTLFVLARLAAGGRKSR
jgi:phosphate transport system permease protein